MNKQVFLHSKCFQETESWHDRNTSVSSLSSFCSCCSLGSFLSPGWFVIMFESHANIKKYDRGRCLFKCKWWNFNLNRFNSGPEWILRYYTIKAFSLPKYHLNDACLKAQLYYWEFLQTFQWYVENNSQEVCDNRILLLF